MEHSSIKNHQTPYLFLTFTFVLLLVGCHKPNPTPELLDPVYKDLQKTLDETKKQLEDEKSILEEHYNTLKNVVPQTGQNKYAEKRVWKYEAIISKTKQQIQYLEMRLNTRKKESRKSYLHAFERDLPWPDPKEYEQYKIHKKLETTYRTKESEKDDKPTPKPKAESGGH